MSRSPGKGESAPEAPDVADERLDAWAVEPLAAEFAIEDAYVGSAADVTGAPTTGGRIARSRLEGLSLAGSRLRSLTLIDVVAVDVDASNADWTGARLKRAALLAGMALAAVNIWTGSPVLALWVGSRLQGTGGVTMGALFAVVACLAVTSFVLLRLLGALGAAHDRLLGLPPPPRRQQPWLRSLSGERLSEQRAREPVSALDVLLVGMVLIASLASDPNQAGRAWHAATTVSSSPSWTSRTRNSL